MIPMLKALEPNYTGLRPRSYDSLTGLPFRPWKHLKNDEVVEDVLNDLRSNDRERDLALRLMEIVDEISDLEERIAELENEAGS